MDSQENDITRTELVVVPVTRPNSVPPFRNCLECAAEAPDDNSKAETVLIQAFKLMQKGYKIEDDINGLAADANFCKALNNCIEHQLLKFKPTSIRRFLVLRSGIQYLCENSEGLEGKISHALREFDTKLDCWKRGDYIDYEYVDPTYDHMLRPPYLSEKHSWWLEP